MRRRAALLSLPLALGLLAGCTGGGTTADTPEQALTSTREAFAEAGTVAVDLTSSNVPEGINGVTAATGKGVIDAAAPKFSGDITGRVLGQLATVPVIAIGDTTWWKLFSTRYREVDLESLGAPNPAGLFHPTEGVPALLEQTTNPATGDEKREGSTVVRTYTGQVPATAVEHLLLLGQDAETFDVTYAVDTSTWQLRSAEIRGEFWKDTESTYTVKLSDYGSPVEITAP